MSVRIAVLMSVALNGCSPAQDAPPEPRIPRAMSVWSDDRPFGQAAASVERKAVQETTGALEQRFPGVRWAGSDAITASNRDAAVAALREALGPGGWRAIAAPEGVPAADFAGWSRGDQLFAVRFIAPYPGRDMRIVAYFESGLAEPVS